MSACCAIPLVAGPTQMRLPLSCATLFSPELASAIKYKGPALAGDTIRNAIGLPKGASPLSALPIQFDAI